MSCPKCGAIPLLCDGCKQPVYVPTPDASSPWQVVDGTIVDASGLRIASATYRQMRGCSMHIGDHEKAQNLALMARAPVLDFTLRELASVLDRKEWGAAKLDEVARLLRQAGYVVRDVDEGDDHG